MHTTVSRQAEFRGVGVHGGLDATAVVKPAPAGTGVVFRRIDLIDTLGEIGARIPARYDRVVDTRLCTVIGSESGATVATIEHLMAAIAGLGISDAVIDVAGPEIPIMDGSAEPFVKGIMAAGIVACGGSRRAIRIDSPVLVRRDCGAQAALAPADLFEIDFEIEFAEGAIGRQTRTATMVNGAFAHDLARARTFGRLQDVEKLRAMGLARGGSLDNAIVVDGDKVLNPTGLRFADEFVRHKILDAVGDLALAGAPIIGRYTGVRAGHEMTNTLLKALFAQPQAWSWVDEDEAARLGPIPAGAHAPLAAAE
ncbi:MAG: UDP-3-O-acyl-N-acetylglucosamine deacetylase [Pseudomonadota bacterium]